MFPRHRRLGDGLLHGTPVGSLRFRPEAPEIEPAGEFLAGIVPFPAPGAGRIGAGGVPEPTHQPPGFRELVAHPGRHHRVAPRHRQPCQRVGQRPARPVRFRHDSTAVGRAGGICQPPPYRRERLGIRRAAQAANLGEKIVEGAARALRLGRGQPVPRRQQVRRGFPQRLPLVAEDIQRETGVEFRIVYSPALESAVLVVLDQVMIGIAGKGEGAEPQRIQRREFQQPQVRLRRGQMGQVEGNQVVAQNERRPVGEIVQRRQRRRQAAAGIHQGLAGVRAYRAKLVDALVFPADLEIQREAGGQENLVFLRCRQRLAVPSHDCLAFGPAWALSAKTWRRPPRSCSGRTVPVRMSSLVDFVGHKETITID